MDEENRMPRTLVGALLCMLILGVGLDFLTYRPSPMPVSLSFAIREQSSRTILLPTPPAGAQDGPSFRVSNCGTRPVVIDPQGATLNGAAITYTLLPRRHLDIAWVETGYVTREGQADCDHDPETQETSP